MEMSSKRLIGRSDKSWTRSNDTDWKTTPGLFLHRTTDRGLAMETTPDRPFRSGKARELNGRAARASLALCAGRAKFLLELRAGRCSCQLTYSLPLPGG